jgi:hypothetical protein
MDPKLFLKGQQPGRERDHGGCQARACKPSTRIFRSTYYSTLSRGQTADRDTWTDLRLDTPTRALDTGHTALDTAHCAGPISYNKCNVKKVM